MSVDTWKKLQIELNSLKLALQQKDVQLIISDASHIKNYPEATRQLQAISSFARRASEMIQELEQANDVVPQRAINEPFRAESVEGDSHTLGNHASVTFPAFKGVKIDGKVDTGATTSSLHASNIKLANGRVSFQCDDLSRNVITLPTEGTQEVHSADYGGDKRPVVRLSVEVNGVPLDGVMFNLNDRSEMDSKLLIGQDILKAGNFQVNVNKDQEAPVNDVERIPETEDFTNQQLYDAIEIIAKSDLTMDQFVQHLRTEAINRIRD
jgi:hypothetical protein